MEIDPHLFADAAISDETRAFNAGLQQLLLAMPKTSSMTPDVIRAARREGAAPWGPVIQSDHARTITIDGPSGPLELRVIDVGESHGLYLHIHGGGWVLGAADLSDVANEAMAREAGVTTVSVEYRLAPEHRFPAGVDDCVAAATWLIEHAGKEFGTDRLTIGGESAGANLAAATLLRIRDEVGYTDWRGANMVYGPYMILSPSVARWDVDGLILDSDTMQWFDDLYRPEEEFDRSDPSLAPIYGDLTDLPPALFTVGTRDPLVDDSLFMAMKWELAGNVAELAIYPGGVHAFDAFPIEIGRVARDRMHSFIRSAVSA